MAQFYTLEEAARVLGMSPEDLKAKAQQREVRGFLDGGRRLFDPDLLDRAGCRDVEFRRFVNRSRRRLDARRLFDDRFRLDLDGFRRFLDLGNGKVGLPPAANAGAGRSLRRGGSRFLGRHRVFLFTHYMGNRFLTFVTNVLYNTMLTDMETCYKVMRREVLQALDLRSRGFGIEPEITAQIFKRGYRVYEVPITYDGRGYDEGKKIGWKDGLVALWVLVKNRF